MSVLLTLAVCFGAFAAVAASNWKPLLGLDLRGGLSVVYCPAAKASNTKCAPAKQVKPQSLTQVVGILQNRVNGLGVAQPNIGVQGSNVVAQLPGVKNPAYVEQILGETAQLYFRPVLCFVSAYEKPASASHQKKGASSAKGSTTSATSTSPLPVCPSTYQPTQTTQNPGFYTPLASYK
ncbi:MAG: hypothetical protein ACRD0B_11605, partial [Acidimicrobiales bacterium]